jgi:hypothetical protein
MKEVAMATGVEPKDVSTVEAPAIPVSECGICDACGRLTIRGSCRGCVSDLWGDPNGISQQRAEERGRQRYREHQQRLEQKRRRKRLEAFLVTKGRGCRQRDLRSVIVEKQARSFTFTLGCDETDLGIDPSNTAHVVASVEDAWLKRAGKRLPRREHRNARGEGSRRRCPGATGAQLWMIKGLSEQMWLVLALANQTAVWNSLEGGTRRGPKGR